MKDGELTCLGDSQHLRSKHGQGYAIEIDFCRPNEFNEATIAFINSKFQNARVLSNKPSHLQMSIPKDSIGLLSSAFAIIEGSKDQLGIKVHWNKSLFQRFNRE